MRLLTLTIALLPITGCAPAPACDPRGDTAVLAIAAEPDGLLPPLIRSDIGTAVADQIFLRLAHLGTEGVTVRDSGFVPMLAEDWTFVDSVTIEFRLHPGARWHDGHPVTAADVVFTFDFYRDPEAAAVSGPQLARIRSVTARGDTVVQFRFTEPYFEQFFDATQHLRILPRHLLDTVPRDRAGLHPFVRDPVGAGPYRFASWDAGEQIVLTADTGFFRGAPDIRRLVWRIVPDQTAGVTALLAGEADMLPRLPGPEQIARAAAVDRVRLEEWTGLTYTYVSFNLRDPERPDAPHPLFADRALRRALARAIDRETLIDAALGGRGVVPRGPITPAVWAWTGAPRQLPHDAEAAAAALDALGWRDADGDGIRERNDRPLAFGFLVPSQSSARNRAGVVLQEQLRRLGVDLRILSVEQRTFNARFEAGRYDAAFGGRFVDPTPAGLLEFWTTDAIEDGYNAEHYSSARFDSLATAAAASRTIETARRLWHEAIAVLNDDAPGVWIYSPRYVAGVRQCLTDVTLVPGQWATSLWTWRIGA